MADVSFEAEFISHSVDDTRALGAKLADALIDGDFVALYGDLGAGKTHFSQGVGEALGIAEALQSPTFNIVFEYTTGRIPLHHFDLYRLGDALELEDIDFYALTDESTPGASLVEWADKFDTEIPEDRLDIGIYRTDDPDVRRFDVVATGPRAARLLEDWRAALQAE